MSLRDEIPSGALIAIDTSPFIYYIEETIELEAVVQDLFEECVDTGRNPSITTVITLAEALVGVHTSGRGYLVPLYRDILRGSENLTLLNLSAEMAERAAELRARYRLRLPDALQLAAALAFGATYFITNDKDLKRVTELRVIVLSEVVS